MEWETRGGELEELVARMGDISMPPKDCRCVDRFMPLPDNYLI